MHFLGWETLGMTRKPYPSDGTDDEWAFGAPYLTLMRADAPQREHDVREGFHGRRRIVRTGSQRRMAPDDGPPWRTVDQQTQRWMAAGVFEAMLHDLRALIRLAQGKNERAPAAMFDSRTVQSAPESGKSAGYDGYKRRKGGKIHLAADALGVLLAAHVTPASEQERAHVQEWAEAGQEGTQDSAKIAEVDQGCTGDEPKQDARNAGSALVVVKLPEAKKGCVLFPKRRAVERRFAWTARFHRLARDVERLPEPFRSVHFLAFALLMVQTFVKTIAHIL